MQQMYCNSCKPGNISSQMLRQIEQAWVTSCINPLHRSEVRLRVLPDSSIMFGDPFLAMPSESLSWQQQRTGKGCGLKAGIPVQEQGT